jgi:hypothetical protein
MNSTKPQQKQKELPETERQSIMGVNERELSMVNQ